MMERNQQDQAPPDQDPSNPHDGLGAAAGLAMAGVAVSLLTEFYLEVTGGYRTAGHALGAVLATIGAAGFFFEVEKATKRMGYADFAGTIVVGVIAAGLLAASKTSGLPSLLTPLLAILGLTAAIIAVIGFGFGVARFFGPRLPNDSMQDGGRTKSPNKILTRYEKQTLVAAYIGMLAALVSAATPHIFLVMGHSS